MDLYVIIRVAVRGSYGRLYWIRRKLSGKSSEMTASPVPLLPDPMLPQICSHFSPNSVNPDTPRTNVNLHSEHLFSTMIANIMATLTLDFLQLSLNNRNALPFVLHPRGIRSLRSTSAGRCSSFPEASFRATNIERQACTMGLQGGIESELNRIPISSRISEATFPQLARAFELDSNRSHTAVDPRFFGRSEPQANIRPLRRYESPKQASQRQATRMRSSVTSRGVITSLGHFGDKNRRSKQVAFARHSLSESHRSQLTDCELKFPTMPKRIKPPLVPTITNGGLGIRIKAVLCHSGYFQPKIPWCIASSVHNPKSFFTTSKR
jgi:hypothetical protein